MFPRGFLPDQDPLESLPELFSPWEQMAKELPKLLVAGSPRSHLLKLPPFPAAALQTTQELDRAMQLLSYLGHAYVWGEKTPPKLLPHVFAQSWYDVAKKVDRPPVLSYASYALHNWRRIQRDGPIELGNIVLIQNFLGGIDEEWFILVHVDIEAKAASGLQGAIDAINAVEANDVATLLKAMQVVECSLQNICKTLNRMPERCDPYIYYHRVRPYIHGWKGHPAFTDGLIYEGVTEYGGKPQQFRGETGAQSSIIPAFDGLLGITHAPDELYHYLLEMREYMPPAHRRFIEYVETKSRVRDFIKEHLKEEPRLQEVYNSSIRLIEQFRRTHLGYAASYIQKQHEKSASNPHAVGTGGTPFMNYLQKHRDETEAFLL